jgi:hypothetical protein
LIYAPNDAFPTRRFPGSPVSSSGTFADRRDCFATNPVVLNFPETAVEIHRLSPRLPLKTPLGEGKAHLYIDGGRDEYGEWVCFLNKDGTSWTFIDPDVRAVRDADRQQVQRRRIPESGSLGSALFTHHVGGRIQSRAKPETRPRQWPG